MEDTPEHIKKLQLEIWLSKTPAERLRQFLIDNDTLFQFWNKAKEKDEEQRQNDKNAGAAEKK